jgi:aspartate/tyrosine/aromatic aminotransferase
MLDQPEAAQRSIADLEPIKSDSLLALIELAKADPRPEKIDVGVGVFRDSNGNTPILKVIKEAERRLWESQESKSYLGGRGDLRFTELLRPILLGEHEADERIAGADPRLAYIADQRGMFSMLPLSVEQVLDLRERHAIYMADSGRFNVVGMSDAALDRFTGAVIEALDG